MSFGQHSQNLLSLHRWETLKKAVYCFTRLKVLEESLDRNSSTRKHRGAPKDIGRNLTSSFMLVLCTDLQHLHPAMMNVLAVFLAEAEEGRPANSADWLGRDFNVEMNHR